MKRKLLSLAILICLVFIARGDIDGSGRGGPVLVLSGVTESTLPITSLSRWERSHVKAVDDAGDVIPGLEGADILAFYLDERTDELGFRISMVQMIEPGSGKDLFDRDKPVLIVLIDHSEGGENGIPGVTGGRSSVEWDEAMILDAFAEEPSARTRHIKKALSGSMDAAPEGSSGPLRRAMIYRDGEYLEGAAEATLPYLEKSKASIEGSSPGAADQVYSDIRARIAATDPTRIRFEVISVAGGRVADRLLGDTLAPAASANCAFVLHGNQGLAYSDVFYGRYDDLEGSGFDEALQVHEGTSIPGNFHLCGPLQTSTEWDRNSGDPNDFNGWLAAGVTAGWAGMVSSAYGQHMMPFVQNAMNDWAVNIQTQMTDTRYGYYPRVAWVPERVWLDPGTYPSAGVIDNLVDNWEAHGVWAVILDDDIHCQGYDNHQIHTISGSTLKVIPRDRDFTGKIVGGDGAGALQVLTDLSNSGVGDYRIALMAEDWEAVAEIGIWASSTPNAKETYDWFINKCQTENSWIAVWKVADAVANPNFNGTAMNITYGTYTEIGGTGGYGGGDNGWYTHWAGYVPYANGGDGYGNCDPGRGGNCKNFGTLWNDAYTALSSAPDNNISQAGWYVLMMNLHETGWHDALGGDISGWQLKYSSHIKNAMMYAEAAHWANGDYAATTAAYFSDIDNDGYDELVMHNDRVFAIFEGIGGRATNVFAKGADYNFSIIGVDNAYWAGTTADYNDVNHIAALSDVGPNYQHSGYAIDIVQGSGPAVEVEFRHEGLTKTVRLTTGQPYLDVIYDTGGGTQYIKNGYSPGLVDLVWNARMDRVWVGDVAYFGQRNPNNGATAAIVTGLGGANHNFEFSGRIMKGDEIYGSGVFEFLLFAGKTSDPDMSGDISELRAIASLTDTIGPDVSWAVYYPGSDKLRIRFNQIVQYSSFSPSGIRIDDDDDGVPELSLDPASTVIETADGFEMTVQLIPSDAAVLEGLDTGALELMLLAGSASDLSSNGNDAIDNTDDKSISYGEATMITIDGYIDPAEWEECLMAVDDSLDSDWTASNEIDALYVAWDSIYLYVALDGIVSGNSWLIYFDVDPGTSSGETDLSAIDAWERGAIFTAPGFACDFEYGCYQHQGQYDTDGFFRIESSTHAEDISDSVITAFDSQHDYGGSGGSELAIPWDILYGLGQGAVPEGASISVVASICWDPEPDGELGGDSAPSNLSAVLPVIDNVYTFVVDGDSDGVPDEADDEGPALESCHRDVSSDSLVNIVFSEPVEEGSSEEGSNYGVFFTTIPSNTVDVVSAQLQPDGVTVQLALAAPIGYGWAVSVTGVTDASCYLNAIIPLSEIMIGGLLTGDDDRVARYRGELEQNYPNPFNPTTTIRFEVPGPAEGEAGVPVNISIYDVRGALVRVLFDSPMQAGPGKVVWDGKNSNGRDVSSGIYFYRIVCGEWYRTRKMVLLR